MNARNFGIATGLGGVASGAAGLIGGHNNPADAGMKYLDQAQQQTGQYYQPYINAGKDAMNNLQGQYGQLLNDPGGKLNSIGQSYHQSPGYQFALQQALQGGDHAAAAGGMAGSPQHEQQNMTLANNIANQDYYNWLGQATGLYGQGLNGEQGINQMGYNASTGLADQNNSIYQNKASLAYQGAANQNQSQGQDIGNMIGGLGALAAFF